MTWGDYVIMEDKYKKSYATRYRNSAEKNKGKADYYYKKFTETNDPDDYVQSQYYYKKYKEDLEILEKYEKMLNGKE